MSFNSQEFVVKFVNTHELSIKRDRRTLEYLANKFLEGNFAKRQGILAPTVQALKGLPRVRTVSRRMGEDTWDHRIQDTREIPYDFSGGGEFDVDLDGNLALNWEDE